MKISDSSPVINKYYILYRSRQLINTDPQRRCYDGCHISSKLVWSGWDVLDISTTKEKADIRLKFWTELNDYAVSQRGEGAKSEYKIVDEIPKELLN